MNLTWLRKNLGLLTVFGFILIFAGLLSLPFLKYPPGRDSNGYFLINPRTLERTYSNEAKEVYFHHAIGITTATVGIGVIIFIPIIVFDRNRKRGSITHQAKQTHSS